MKKLKILLSLILICISLISCRLMDNIRGSTANENEIDDTRINQTTSDEGDIEGFKEEEDKLFTKEYKTHEIETISGYMKVVI